MIYRQARDEAFSFHIVITRRGSKIPRGWRGEGCSFLPETPYAISDQKMCYTLPSPSLFQTWIARCPQGTDNKEFPVIGFGSREHKTKEISK